MMICCVKVGDKYGDDYVLKLRDGVARHLKAEHLFLCITDKPVDGVDCIAPLRNWPGWWAKVNLFGMGLPLIYFDLDVIITGDLQPLLDWQGFGIIADYWQPMFNSSVMKLAGNEGHVFDLFSKDDMARCRHGDQQWITERMPKAATFPKSWFPSYKADSCESEPPAGSLAVVFHGQPKPPDCGGWVKEQWV